MQMLAAFLQNSIEEVLSYEKSTCLRKIVYKLSIFNKSISLGYQHATSKNERLILQSDPLHSLILELTHNL